MNLRKMILSSILISIIVVLGIYMIPIFSSKFRISTSILLLSSFIVGPLYGGIIGLISDLLGGLFRGMGINLYTLTNIIFGFLPFVIFKIFPKTNTYIKIIISCYITLFLGSLINTLQEVLWIGDYRLYIKLLYAKTASYIIIFPIHITIVCLLYKPIEKIKKQFNF